MKSKLSSAKEFSELPSAARALAVSPDRNRFAVGLRDGTVLTWGIEGEGAGSQSVHLQAVYDVCWHPSGRLILSCSADRTARVLEADSLACVRVISHPSDSIRAVRWSPHQDLLCWGAQDGRLQILDSYAVKWEREDGPPVRQVRWNPSGDLIGIFSDSSSLQVLRVPSFEWVPSIEQEFGASICAGDWLSDRVLVLGTTSGQVIIADVLSPKLVASVKCHHAAIAAVSICEDRRAVASRARDGTIEVLSLPELHRLRTGRVSVGEYVPPILAFCGAELLASDKMDSIVVALAPVDDKTSIESKVYKYRATRPKRKGPMNAANDHLSILHISDLHCEEGDKTNLMLEQLVSDLHDQDLPAIKHIVISGDLANRAKAAEYKLAAEFTLKLLESLSLGPDDVTVVPGNHDVDYGASQRAYEMNWSKTYNEKDPAIIPMPGVGHFLRDDEKYKERFKNWSREFYAKIIGAEYPLEADQQYCVTVKGAVVFLALNSAWEVDHHYEKRMSINGDALAHGLNMVRGKNGLGPNLLKIAVWHHPISGPQSMSDDFVNLLVQNGFSIGLHGDVHHSVKGYKELDDVRGLRVIGAGTHASAAKQMPPGTPREYHTIVIDLQNRRARVNSRYRSDQQGAWRPNAIYGTKDQPLAWYEFGF